MADGSPSERMPIPGVDFCSGVISRPIMGYDGPIDLAKMLREEDEDPIPEIHENSFTLLPFDLEISRELLGTRVQANHMCGEQLRRETSGKTEGRETLCVLPLRILMREIISGGCQLIEISEANNKKDLHFNNSTAQKIWDILKQIDPVTADLIPMHIFNGKLLEPSSVEGSKEKRGEALR
jgi:hypothetical protein